jgi:autophagy-related protein 2
MQHIQTTQLPSLLSGLTPIRTLTLLGSGTADLVLMPLKQYQRDGRFVRGLQKGARKFVQTAVVEVMRVGAKVAVGAQGMLERVDAMLDGRSKARRDREFAKIG